MKSYIRLYTKAIFFKNTLTDIDEFYRNIVSKMPNTNKINYCESLIFRTMEDIKHCNCKIKKLKLKQLVKASIFELKKLEEN